MVASPPPPPLPSLQLPTLLRHRGCLLALHALDPPSQLHPTQAAPHSLFPAAMAAEPALTPEQLAQQPDFVSDLASVDAALIARALGRPVSCSALANQAADRLASRIMRCMAATPGPLTAVPAALAPATTAVLRFWLPHIPEAAPAEQLCPEVQAVLKPSTRAAAGAFLAELAARGEQRGPGPGPRQTAASPSMIVTLPMGLLAPGAQLPFGRSCRIAAQKGMLMMGGPPPHEEVPGVSGVGGLPRQLNLQTLAFALATVEGQVRLMLLGSWADAGWVHELLGVGCVCMAADLRIGNLPLLGVLQTPCMAQLPCNPPHLTLALRASHLVAAAAQQLPAAGAGAAWRRRL